MKQKENQINKAILTSMGINSAYQISKYEIQDQVNKIIFKAIV